MASSRETNAFYNKPAKGISYYTPAQDPPSGTLLEAAEGKKEPKLFTPLKIGGLELQNRIMVRLEHLKVDTRIRFNDCL
jgi:hypothetical protein